MQRIVLSKTKNRNKINKETCKIKTYKIKLWKDNLKVKKINVIILFLIDQ